MNENEKVTFNIPAMVDDLARVHNGLQHLQGVPVSRPNVAILDDTLSVIEAAHKYFALLMQQPPETEPEAEGAVENA
jgi:hypothetical protein